MLVKIITAAASRLGTSTVGNRTIESVGWEAGDVRCLQMMAGRWLVTGEGWGNTADLAFKMQKTQEEEKKL